MIFFLYTLFIFEQTTFSYAQRYQQKSCWNFTVVNVPDLQFCSLASNVVEYEEIRHQDCMECVLSNSFVRTNRNCLRIHYCSSLWFDNITTFRTFFKRYQSNVPDWFPRQHTSSDRFMLRINIKSNDTQSISYSDIRRVFGINLPNLFVTLNYTKPVDIINLFGQLRYSHMRIYQSTFQLCGFNGTRYQLRFIRDLSNVQAEIIGSCFQSPQASNQVNTNVVSCSICVR